MTDAGYEASKKALATLEMMAAELQGQLRVLSIQAQACMESIVELRAALNAWHTDDGGCLVDISRCPILMADLNIAHGQSGSAAPGSGDAD